VAVVAALPYGVLAAIVIAVIVGTAYLYRHFA
jgi:hypothetical protein